MLNVFVAIGKFFQKIGSLLKKGVVAAHESGLTDEIVGTALKWVKVAADKFVDNAEKREFVVRVLVCRGVPEALARLAVELAVQIYKKEAAELGK